MSNWLNVDLVLHVLGENISALSLHLILDIIDEHKIFLLFILVLSMMAIVWVVGYKILQRCPLRLGFLTIASLFDNILYLAQVMIIHIVATCA